MLNLKLILNKTEYVKNKLKLRGFDISKVDEIVQLGQLRSKYMTELQKLEARRNLVSKEVAHLKLKGNSANDKIAQVQELKKTLEKLKGKETQVNSLIMEKLLLMPNLPTNEVPQGDSESDNLVIAEHINIGRGKISNVKSHHEIAINLDIVDFKRAVKLSGSRFWIYKGVGAKLVRALENFMLDTHIKKGYVEFRPPVIVKSEIMQGTGQLPKFKDDLFQIQNSDSYLIPTAEVPLINYFQNEIINLDKTKSFTAFTPCFRSEAGSGGKDLKGLIRSHQFNKVELVKFTNQQNLEKEFQQLINDAKCILDKLKLPYREVLLCGGDLGFAAEKTVDLEVWMPHENKFREVSSISTCGDFQGRRAAIRYKNLEGKNQYAFTINGSGLAIDRIVGAILENYQNPDFSVTIPDALVSYMNQKIIQKKNSSSE